MFGKESPEAVTIFRCENGFGVEFVTGIGDPEEERFTVKRYVASSMDEVFERIKRYFQGEI